MLILKIKRLLFTYYFDIVTVLTMNNLKIAKVNVVITSMFHIITTNTIAFSTILLTLPSNFTFYTVAD